MRAHFYVCLFLTAYLVVSAEAKQNCGPIEQSFIGKGYGAINYCGRGGVYHSHRFKFFDTGLRYSPLYGLGDTCQDQIFISFRKKNKTALIYYRPAPKPQDFENIAPQHHAGFKQRPYDPPNWPCHKIQIKVQKVHV